MNEYGFCAAFDGEKVVFGAQRPGYLLKNVEEDEVREWIVVNCSGGPGRTGHVLGAWLVFGRGFSIEDALKAVERAGRDPYEAVRCGNAEEDDLIDILKFAQTLRT